MASIAMAADIAGTSTVTGSLRDGPSLAATSNGSASVTLGTRLGHALNANIHGTSRPTALITVLRHRALALSVNAGAYADNTFSTTLTASSGPGIRQIGELQEQIRPQTANYV